MNVVVRNNLSVIRPAGSSSTVAVEVGNAAVLLTEIQLAAIPNGARYAWVNANTNGCNLTFDGTTPTTTVGVTIAANAGLLIDIALLITAKAVSLTGTCNVTVSYFG
jgi:hypothetical protein